MSFDVAQFRSEFPILSRQIHGKPLVYFDSAASAQKPKVVIEAMVRAMEQSYANVHRGLHSLANEATDAYEGAREKVAQFLKAPTSETIIFTKGATEAINLVAASFGIGLNPGDEIILSELEHHANFIPWHFLRQSQGVALRFVPVTDEGGLDMEAYETLLGPKTRLVALTHMSNVTGARTQAAQIVKAAHSVGAKVLLDGCQAIVHGPVDVTALDVDFYVFSAHKLYGPTGIGVLYGKKDLLEALPPYQGGGEMIASVSLDHITYAAPPYRFEAGTPPIIEAIGLGATLDWLQSFDREAAFRHEEDLYRAARDGLSDIPGLRILGSTPDKAAILTFVLEGVHPHDLAHMLDLDGIALRAGTHCAEPLMHRFGVTASARASFLPYNSLDEVTFFLQALKKAYRFLTPRSPSIPHPRLTV